MTAAPPEDLDALTTHIAERLRGAADSRKGPWRTPVLSTVGAGGPNARVVVIRSIEPAARRIEIFTDSRSAKLAEIAADPRVALTFWDPDAHEQLRIAAVARTVEDTALVDARWEAIGPVGQALYGDGPAAATRGRFVVIEAVWSLWDWLWIGATPHRRARITWERGAPQGRWIAP